MNLPVAGFRPVTPVYFAAARQNTSSGLRQTKRHLLSRINRPVLPPERLNAWLAQFAPRDRKTALKLVEQIRFHTYPDMIDHMRALHKQVLVALARDGYIGSADHEVGFDRVDFSRIYTAKSGDIVSTLYRKANKIRGVSFKTLDALEAEASKMSQSNRNRALVILDDYTSTGVQFLYEACARHYQNLFKQYGKVYFAVVTTHQKAADKFRRLAKGDAQSVADDIIADLHRDENDPAFNAGIQNAMRDIAGNKIELIPLYTEVPMLSPENTSLTAAEKEELRAFLQKYNVYKYPFGVGHSQGQTSFFYGAPNTLPDLLWNSKSRKADGSPWLPLFDRTEDVSIYAAAQYYPPEKQVW